MQDHIEFLRGLVCHICESKQLQEIKQRSKQNNTKQNRTKQNKTMRFALPWKPSCLFFLRRK